MIGTNPIHPPDLSNTRSLCCKVIGNLLFNSVNVKAIIPTHGNEMQELTNNQKDCITQLNDVSNNLLIRPHDDA